MNRRLIVSIIGDSVCTEGTDKWNAAFNLGKALVDNGYRVLTGGCNGVMNAAMAGAHSSKKYREGDTIAIMPMYDGNLASPYADIVIPTGLDFYRDLIVANSEVVIAVGGGSGTLNEATAAWAFCRLIIAYRNVKGWSSKIADTRLDNRHMYGGVDDIIHGVDNEKEVIKIIKEKLPNYNKVMVKITIKEREITQKAPSNWAGPVPYKSQLKK